MVNRTLLIIDPCRVNVHREARGFHMKKRRWKKKPIQLEMFGPPFVKGSATSAAAADSVREVTGKMRIKVYQILLTHTDGLTDLEQQQLIPMNASTQRPRRIELVDQGWVIDSGRTRLTPSNRSAVIWIIKPQEPKSE
jgi:hypothetical protein